MAFLDDIRESGTVRTARSIEFLQQRGKGAECSWASFRILYGSQTFWRLRSLKCAFLADTVGFGYASLLPRELSRGQAYHAWMGEFGSYYW